MTFDEYLTKRRVNVAAFAAAEPQRFSEWQNWFGQMHPESFYMLVKMVLNDVRRNYWLAEVPKPVAVAEAAESAATVPGRPAGRRAAITRPAAATPEAPATEAAKPVADISATEPSEIASTGTSEETSVAKPARPVFKPRGVIKKPTEALAEEATSETSAIEKTTEAKKSEEAKPTEEINSTAEKAEETPAKAARSRAVIKRPAALNKPKAPEETTEETPGNSAEIVEETNSGTAETLSDSGQKVEAETTKEPPKPPRPRPVFKRPVSSTSTEPNSEVAEKTLGETSEKPEKFSAAETPTENPVAKPGQEGASEAKAVSEEIHDNPEAAKAAEEIAAAAGAVPKPARPRPVFKRPAAPNPSTENSVKDPGKTLGETTQKPEAESTETQPEKLAESPAKTPRNTEQKVDEPTPKPPRPRPIFKRPAKPADDPENPL